MRNLNNSIGLYFNNYRIYGPVNTNLVICMIYMHIIHDYEKVEALMLSDV